MSKDTGKTTGLYALLSDSDDEAMDQETGLGASSRPRALSYSPLSVHANPDLHLKWGPIGKGGSPSVYGIPRSNHGELSSRTGAELPQRQLNSTNSVMSISAHMKSHPSSPSSQRVNSSRYLSESPVRKETTVSESFLLLNYRFSVIYGKFFAR